MYDVARTIFTSFVGLSVFFVSYHDALYLEDFRDLVDISHWIEHSDTIEELGKSKAALVLHKMSQIQRAILFTRLDPQPSGAAFAGVRMYKNFDLTPYKSLELRVRGKGSYNGYKVVLRQKNENYSFCNFFKTDNDFSEISLSLTNFKPFHEGQLIEDDKALLNLSAVVSIDLQAFGGAYLPIKQSGAAALEIEWIKII